MSRWSDVLPDPTTIRNAALAVAVGVTAAACGAAGGPALGNRWDGDCPAGAGPDSVHLIAIELSPSERDGDLVYTRLQRMERHVAQAVDCEAPLEVVLLDRSRVEAVHTDRFTSDVNTERARDLKVLETARASIDEITAALQEPLAAEPLGGSDPGALFRALDDRLRRLGSDGEIRVLVLSDGVTETEAVSLNRAIQPDEVATLADAVAPDVDLAGRVHVDWPDMGRTADAGGVPGDWLDALVDVWTTACRDRGATTCTITST